MSHYDELQESIISGKKARVGELTQQFLDEDKLAKEILDEGLIPGMTARPLYEE